MTWTLEKPTKPGWYWYRTDEKQNQLMDIRKLEEQMTAGWPSGRSEPVDSMPGEWSGPLERVPH